MSLRFGILWPFRNPEFARVPWEQLYRSHLDLIADSEAMGFDDAWLTEHHFVDDGYSPSLLPIAGAVAAYYAIRQDLADPLQVCVMLWAFTHGLIQIATTKSQEIARHGVEVPKLMEDAYAMLRRMLVPATSI